MSIYEKYYNDTKTKNLKFGLYGYAPPMNYALEIDGYKTAPIEDFRTVERYKEYKETGFNILLAQTSCTYMGEEWESSDAKMVMDRAYKAGIEKIILLDERLRGLSSTENGLIGEEKPFQTQKELEAYVAECMEPYKAHPAFYGVQLKDEPRSSMFEAIGQIYKAVKKVKPDAFIQCNLFPLVVLGATNAMYPNPDGGDLYDRFKDYLCAFIDATGADYIMYDNYPILEDKGYGTVFYRMYFRGLQIAAQVCKERGVKFYFVMQAYGYRVNGEPNHRLPNEAEIFYQINALLGFGVKQIAYFTYWTKTTNDTRGESYPDGMAMMKRNGEKTPVYGYVQKANAMVQTLAPVIANFEYVTDRYVIKTPFRTHPFHLEYTGRGYLTNVTEAHTSQEVALINEMYDKQRDQWLYRVQNITYNYYEERLNLQPQTTTLTFDKKFTKADVFYGEVWKTVDLIDGEYTTAPLKAGYAEYILPY